MNDEFVITADILENPRFLACSVPARNLYLALILRTDHEGRSLADPLTLMGKAALFGPAGMDLQEVEDAAAELDRARLAPRYEVDGKVYLFLPGRFEHNKRRLYWRRSKHPLPPAELLGEFPEYLNDLRRLTTKSELRNSLRQGENWRYPDVAHGIPESGGQVPGNDGNEQGNSGDDEGERRASPVEVEVEVEEEEGECARTRVAASVPDRSAPATKPDGPPRDDPRASRKQIRFCERLLAQHDLTLQAWCTERALSGPLLDSHVDEIRETYGRPPAGSGPPARRHGYELEQPEDPPLSDADRAEGQAVLASLRKAGLTPDAMSWPGEAPN